MKRLFTVLLLIFFIGTANAEFVPSKRINSMPEGVFKKTRSGKIVQYNSKGKKIGIYKYSNGRYVNVK